MPLWQSLYSALSLLGASAYPQVCSCPELLPSELSAVSLVCPSAARTTRHSRPEGSPDSHRSEQMLSTTAASALAATSVKATTRAAPRRLPRWFQTLFSTLRVSGAATPFHLWEGCLYSHCHIPYLIGSGTSANSQCPAWFSADSESCPRGHSLAVGTYYCLLATT